MAKKMLIDATHAEETRVVVADGNKVEEFDFESLNKRQLAGNIYLAKVTRVEPSLQAAFVDYGGNRHGFLAFSEIHPDYYQIPVADREALLAEERAYAEAQAKEEADAEAKPKRRRRRRKIDVKAESAAADAVATGDIPSGMDVVDLENEGADDQGPSQLGDGDAKTEASPDTVSDDAATSDENAADQGSPERRRPRKPLVTAPRPRPRRTERMRPARMLRPQPRPMKKTARALRMTMRATTRQSG